MMKLIKLNIFMGRDEVEIRSDSEGDGAFGAKRGDRKHKGIDLVCIEGDALVSPVQGKITKIGYPYATGYGGLHSENEVFRYIEITTEVGTQNALRHRFFYVTPLSKLGANVKPGVMTSSAMDISKRYDTEDNESKMIPHVHYEILDVDGKAINPQEFEFPEILRKSSAPS